MAAYFFALEEIVVNLSTVLYSVWYIVYEYLPVSISMPAINCDQFTKILDEKLDPLNSTISELKKIS